MRLAASETRRSQTWTGCERGVGLEAAMATLQEQAVRVEAMASRSVSASASVSAFDLEPEDPLLRRFKELEDK